MAHLFARSLGAWQAEAAALSAKLVKEKAEVRLSILSYLLKASNVRTTFPVRSLFNY